MEPEKRRRSDVMGTRPKGSTLARLLLAAMALGWATAWSVEAWAERRGIAVVIGNSDYGGGDIPPEDYAYWDAEAFKRYVVDVLGYAERDVIHMKDATRRQMLEVLGAPDAVMNDLQARLNLLGTEGAGTTVLTAVARTQIATWDKRARQGLFTQHLLEALYEGKGDQDRDGTVTAAEVKAYLDRHMTAGAWLEELRQPQATLRGSGGEVLASASPGGVFPKRPDLGDAGAEDKGPVATEKPAPGVEPDWDHETRRMIQLGLNGWGFETGSADGIFGEKNRAAIRKSDREES